MACATALPALMRYHETAKAIAGIADGSIAGSSSLQGGSGGGAGGGDIKLNLTSGSFEGTEYTYTAKESGLEDFISKVESLRSSVLDKSSSSSAFLIRIRFSRSIASR